MKCEFCQQESEESVCSICDKAMTISELEAQETLVNRFKFLEKILKPNRLGILRVLGFSKDKLDNQDSWENLIFGREGATEILVDVMNNWLEFYDFNWRFARQQLIKPTDQNIRFLPTDVNQEDAWLTMFWVSNRESTCIKMVLGRDETELP